MITWKIFVLLLGGLLVLDSFECTLSPPTEKTSKKDKFKIHSKKGPVNQDVFERLLVVKEPKVHDILRESGLYFHNTTWKRFSGDVLGYITPWNSNGFEIAKTFHGKFSMVSPVWLALPGGNTTKYKLSTHDVQKKWLKDMRASDTKNHRVKILPRVLFENWSANDIVGLYRNTHKQSELASVLSETAKTFRFDGYVLEIWNQFVYTGVDPQITVSLIKSMAQALKTGNLDIILAIPPSRGKAFERLSRDRFDSDHFDQLSSHVRAFSLMTYDYSSIQRPGPNSPVNWVRRSVEALVPKMGPKRSRILLGLNFYGYRYTLQGGGPILGSEYLKILESFRGNIQWDDKSKEHFFESKSTTGSGSVFYPTLYSIKHRLELATELGTGVSIWELGQGLNYFYDLL